MCLNTFVQKHTNSKYYMTLLCAVGVCLAKCYQLHPSSIIHALSWDSGQTDKPVNFY